MTDHRKRLDRLEGQTRHREPNPISDPKAVAELEERLTGEFVDGIGNRHRDPHGGWLDEHGELRTDLPADERAIAQEVLDLLAVGQQRAQEAREQGDPTDTLH